MTKNNGYLTGLTEQVVTKSLIYHRQECDRLPRSGETRRPYDRGDRDNQGWPECDPSSASVTGCHLFKIFLVTNSLKKKSL